MRVPELIVQAIFRSVDGEVNGYDGPGQLSTFIRLRGCNLKCTYCDTVYAQSVCDGGGQRMRPVDIIRQVQTFPGRKVTLTGGDPLFQLPNVMELISQLLQHGYSTTVETNGSFPIRSYGFNNVPRMVTRASTGLTTYGSVRFVVDYKLPSSCMEDRMVGENWHDLTEYDVVKFVISDRVDLDRALEVVQDHGYCKALMVFSPAIDLTAANPMEWPATLATKLLEDHNLPCKIHYSLQIHKVLWPGATNER